MLQQQAVRQGEECRECGQKQAMLDKFTELVHLLRKKAQKHDQSKMKSSLHSQLNWIHANHSHSTAILKLVVVVEKSVCRTTLNSFKMIQKYSRHRSLPFITHPTIIKQLKDNQLRMLSGDHQEARNTRSHQKQPKQGNLQNLHTSTESFFGFPEEFKIKKSPKLLLKKIFQITHENEALALKLREIQNNLSENIRRSEREMAKKREGFQGLVDELSEKNEVIEELKETIKSLQAKLGAKDNLVLHQLLEEDGQTLRKAILKLQNTNEKLNNDLLKVRGQKSIFQKQNRQLSKTIESQKSQISGLKEILFENEQQAKQNSLQKRELEIMSQKISAKLEKIRRIEKKCNEVSRGKDSISTNPDQLTISKSDRKAQTTLNSLQRTDEERISQLETKLEAVFTFLFNLQNQAYQLHSAELFDEEEKELMLTHQLKFIANMRAHDLQPIQIASKRCILTEKEVISIGDSFLEAFQTQPLVPPKPASHLNPSKLIQFETERNKLREKISEVKEKELHLRCVILQLLKSLDLRAIKKDTEGIVTLLCDLFQYSEEERVTLWQSKNKKFFGLI